MARRVEAGTGKFIDPLTTAIGGAPSWDSFRRRLVEPPGAGGLAQARFGGRAPQQDTPFRPFGNGETRVAIPHRRLLPTPAGWRGGGDDGPEVRSHGRRCDSTTAVPLVTARRPQFDGRTPQVVSTNPRRTGPARRGDLCAVTALPALRTAHQWAGSQWWPASAAWLVDRYPTAWTNDGGRGRSRVPEVRPTPRRNRVTPRTASDLRRALQLHAALSPIRSPAVALDTSRRELTGLAAIGRIDRVPPATEPPALAVVDAEGIPAQSDRSGCRSSITSGPRPTPSWPSRTAGVPPTRACIRVPRAPTTVGRPTASRR